MFLSHLIYQRITSEYVDPENYCPRRVLKKVAKDVATENGISNFEASNSWQKGFMACYNLSCRRPHARRRIEPSECEEFDAALAQFPKCLIFNMDETSWRIVNGSLTTIQRKGKDDVSIHLS